jgi:hypothetical protein
MLFPVTTIAFEPIPTEAEGWCIVATFPDGHAEHVKGFVNEGEARDWIGSPPCMEWAKAKGYN